MTMNEQVARSSGRIGAYVLGGLLFLVFAAAGAVKLVPIEFERTNFEHFGYATWFMYAIGGLEIIGALMLLTRPARVLGSVLLAVIMAGAATSHLRAGDGIGTAMPALILLVLLMALAVVDRSGLRSGLRMSLLSRTA